MSSSTNSATLAPHKYEVFLSFRGEDTRYGFVSHLFKALVGKGIRTYIDEKSLERGNEIEYSLQHAIQESKACVVVFSENYGSSRWCLDELVHILKCKERHGQTVVPIFYHVLPNHVRNQKGRFGEAFSTLVDRFPGSSVGWRTALSTASGLAGWHLSGTR